MNRREFMHQTGMYSLGGILLLNAETFSTNLMYATPESVGITSESIINYIKAADGSGLEHHGFMMSRYGKIIAEAYWKPFAADHIHTLYSLSKSFTSTAVGLAIQEGKMKLTDKVISFFPEHLPSVVSDHLASLEVRHALNMATGHTKDTMGPMRAATNQSWIKTFFEQPFEKAPGTHFLYNTGSTYVCGAIVSKLTGKTLLEYLTPAILNPLGITGSDWETSPEGYNVAGYGLRVTTRDIIKFGNLYLNKGKLNGKPLINEAYVNDATTSHIASTPTGGDWGEGYGYQFWRCRHNFYRGDGAFGQYCIIMPQHGIVIALNSESSNMQKQMNLMWEHLLPGIKDKRQKKNSKAFDELQTLSNDLKISPVLGDDGASIIGNGQKAILDENEMGWKSMEVKNDTLYLSNDANKVEIPFGWNVWKESKNRIVNPFNKDNRSLVPSKVAATAGIQGNELKIRLKYTEGIHGDLLSIKRNEDNTVEMNFLQSLAEKGANNTKETRKPFTGKLV